MIDIYNEGDRKALLAGNDPSNLWPMCGPICALNAIQAVKIALGQKPDDDLARTLSSLQEAIHKTRESLSTAELDEVLSYLVDPQEMTYSIEVLKVAELSISRNMTANENLGVSRLVDLQQSRKIISAYVFDRQGNLIDGHYFNIRSLAQRDNLIILTASDPSFPGKLVQYEVFSMSVNDSQKTIGLAPIGKPPLESQFGAGYFLAVHSVTSIRPR